MGPTAGASAWALGSTARLAAFLLSPASLNIIPSLLLPPLRTLPPAAVLSSRSRPTPTPIRSTSSASAHIFSAITATPAFPPRLTSTSTTTTTTTTTTSTATTPTTNANIILL
eukprot:gb/GEZN01029034.1/.p1 GENE.gb/GEZN01029034.1/~~gb/GEZN01029034.1/.p1  ORF type:complete len:113 (-),score=41.45 gb/GEZN01029034.1/:38-376(-)